MSLSAESSKLLVDITDYFSAGNVQETQVVFADVDNHGSSEQYDIYEQLLYGNHICSDISHEDEYHI